MLQNWLKPIKGHNGPVPALNDIPEPGRNRVKKGIIMLELIESQKLSKNNSWKTCVSYRY